MFNVRLQHECLLPGLIYKNCSYPIKCECNKPFGGNDCSQDLSNIAEFTIRPKFCDLRTENCSLINGFGYPFSTRDPIFVKAEYIEVFFNSNYLGLLKQQFQSYLEFNNLKHEIFIIQIYLIYNISNNKILLRIEFIYSTAMISHIIINFTV
ncbi:hypothetical protein BpHYR1_043794 [Brachionus plicatilis]|uniref:Uncharacterized protein n=1 Tax=Brachionus plicatilis TaxID=10195 RepID=A0A3M7QPL7_BRAPC|nr:hypothetical protein BpHYR1_043794 [Brachionus plicatilis]